MKQLKLGNGALEAPQIGLGCMKITGLGTKQAVRALIDTATDQGINFFDHADIYASGEAERVFGEAAGPALREKMMIQTKCAIRPGVCCDFSKEHILESVDGSLNWRKSIMSPAAPSRWPGFSGTRRKCRPSWAVPANSVS